MKCEKCGKEISNVGLDMFIYDGTDMFIKYPVTEVAEDAIELETTANWVGHDLSIEEQVATIRCPRCFKFPFKNEDIQVYEVTKIVCFKSPEKATN